MIDPVLHASRTKIGSGVDFGPNVFIEAEDLVIGEGASIGHSGTDDFRTSPGVYISGRRIRIGPHASIGRSVRIDGGDITLGAHVRVLRNATLNIAEQITVGDYGGIGESCEISGRDVTFGQELWMLPHAKIGGGSAFEAQSRFRAGHYLHLGAYSMVNTARPVEIGHEVGLGTRTSVYTHGAYSSALMGFPVDFGEVTIGDFSWVPGATINPGVRIGRNCVVGVNSLVTRSLPDGCLAAGSPAKVIRERAYPNVLKGSDLRDFYHRFLEAFSVLLSSESELSIGSVIRLDTPDAVYVASEAFGAGLRDGLSSKDRVLLIAALPAAVVVPPGWTIFDTAGRHITGVADRASARLANELRRYGIRFYSRPDAGSYVAWESNAPRFGG